MEEISLVNTRLGKYQVQAEIGRGGMAVVYRGYDPTLERTVAIKVLAQYLVWQKEAVERFVREARAAAQLKHPNIVTIYDVGQESGWYYFVMEFLEGRELTDYIREQGTFTTADVITILRPVAAALDYAHQQGLIHRDVKPANIVVDKHGVPKLTDFGIARMTEGTRVTSTGTIMGTPEYMSPEQAQGLAVDARTDQFSLAIVAYEILSGQVPFMADSTMAILYRITHDPLPPLAKLRPDLPKGVATVMERALAKSPADRFPTASAFVEALEQALAGKPVKAFKPTTKATTGPAPRLTTPAMGIPPVPVAAPEHARRRIPVWVWLLVALSILGLGAYGVWAGWIPLPAFTPPAPTASLPTATSAPTNTPDATATSAMGTIIAVAQTVGAPTATPPPSPTASRTPMSTRTPRVTSTPTMTRTPKATLTPTAPPTTAPTTPRPTSTPGAPRPTSTPGAPRPTSTPAATTAPASGALITFEQMGTWRRGDEPYGEFVQTQEQVHTGAYAAKLTYNFPAVQNDYVVFMHALNLGSQVDTLRAWVYGDGSRNFLNIWISDANGQIWAIPLGRIGGAGWQQMIGTLTLGQAWPFGPISGPDNGAIDYPVSLYALVLDRADSSTAASGAIYVDDITAWKSKSGGVQPTAPPVAAAATPVPAATSAPAPSGPIGRIVFTVKVGETYYLYSTDPNWSQMQEIGMTDNAHWTCSGGVASTLSGQSVALYGVNRHAISGRVESIAAPNGSYKVITNNLGDSFTLSVNSADDTDQRFYFQGPLNRNVGIVWSPTSQYFLFGSNRNVNIIQPGLDNYRTIIGTIEDAWPPQFSPDGALIYYLQPVGSEGASDVFVISPDGSGARNLTNAPIAYKLCPRWRQ